MIATYALRDKETGKIEALQTMPDHEATRRNVIITIRGGAKKKWVVWDQDPFGDREAAG